MYMYIYICIYILSVCVLCGSPVWPSPPVVGPLWGPPLCVGPLCGSPVRVPCAGPLCGSPVWVPSVWVPCVGPSSRCVHVASTRVMSPARSHAPAYIYRFKCLSLFVVHFFFSDNISAVIVLLDPTLRVRPEPPHHVSSHGAAINSNLCICIYIDIDDDMYTFRHTVQP